MDYLKDRQYYEDLYDLHTIEICIDWVKLALKKCKDDKAFSKFPKEDRIRGKNILIELPLYYQKGERYRDKEKTINEWIEKDKIKQDKFDDTKEPNGIFCQECNWAMKLEGKSLHDFSNEPLRILFFFECPNCHKRRGIFDDGTEYKSEPRVCPKCGDELELSYKNENEVSTFAEKCKSCDYKTEDKTDFKLYDERQKKREERKEYLLNKYRKECCLTPEEGEKYISSQTQLKNSIDRIKETERKEADPIYQKARALKKLKVFDMEKLLKETLEKEKYIELSFDKPEITKDVVIPFSVQESDTSRSDYDSQNNLKKLIKKTLEDTNWRLMSDGISQRLGILTGRIRGYENEDDLVKIVKI